MDEQQIKLLSALEQLKEQRKFYEEINDILEVRYKEMLEKNGEDRKGWSKDALIEVSIVIFAGITLDAKRTELNALEDVGDIVVDVLYAEKDESKIN